MRTAETEKCAEYEFTAEGVTLTLMTNLAFPITLRADITDHVHMHSVYECFYVAKGSLLFHIGEECREINEGELLVVAPNATHYATFDGGEHYVLKFSVESHKGNKRKNSFAFLAFDGFRVVSLDRDAEHLVRMLHKALREKRGALAGSTLYALLSLLSEQIVALEAAALADNTAKRIYKLEELLHYYYDDETCNLHRLAEELHLSERQLSRIVKRECGMTFRRRLSTVRVETAKRLLDGGEPIARVAAAVGYSSLSAFYTAYKKHYGVPPGRERKEKKKTE